jgi:hypothetical protein
LPGACNAAAGCDVGREDMKIARVRLIEFGSMIDENCAAFPIQRMNLGVLK